MAQIFRPRSVLLLKLGLIGLALLVSGVVLTCYAVTAESHGIGEAVENPRLPVIGITWANWIATAAIATARSRPKPLPADGEHA